MRDKTGAISSSRTDATLLHACVQTERLQALLADNDKVYLSDIEPIPLPLEPQIRIKGIVPETATLFKVREEHQRFSVVFRKPCMSLHNLYIYLSLYLSVYVLAVSSSAVSCHSVHVSLPLHVFPRVP